MPTQTASELFVEDRATVTATLAEQLAQNRYIEQLRAVSKSELSAMIDRILDQYGQWSGGDEHALADCLDLVGNMCFALSIPLAEAAYGLYALRDGIQAMISAGATGEKSDTLKRVNSFFEALVRGLLRRY